MTSSLANILNIATSGLSVAQAQVSATSNNISNMNTAGYARQVVNQSETVVAGQGLGVHVDSIVRAANTFLEQANLQATAQSSQASVISNFLDQAQQAFGDPSSSSSFFSRLDSVYSAFSAAADNPSSSLSQSSAVNSLSSFLNDASTLSSNLSGLRVQANDRIGSDITQINSLLGQIAQDNTNIAQLTANGADISGVQNNQAQLLQQLSGLMQVQVNANNSGGVTLRSQDGVYLVGDQGPATLNYTTIGGGGLLTATPPKGQPAQISVNTGEVAGLMQLAGSQIPQIQSQLGQFVSQAVGQINAAYNNSSTVPAPDILTGQAIGMSLPTAIGNFSGDTTIAITNAQGVMQQRVDISFGYGVGTMNVTDNSGATSTLSFTSANFLSQLNTALGAEGGASFSNGVLSIGANNAADGVSIEDSSTNPSSNNGIGFSQFFGMNNLVQSSVYPNTSGALSATSPNTFAAGSGMSLELTDANGAAVRQINLTVPASATTVGDLINALNSNIGAYGSFALNGQGQLAFTPVQSYAGSSISVISDDTNNTAGGPPLSQMLGIGVNTQAALASSFSVRSDIAANPQNLGFAQLDLSQTVNGLAALGVGDGSGAAAIANSGSNTITFSPAGAMPGGNMSVSTYASQFAGQVATAASAADNASQSASALQTQASTQLSSAEGVNLDTELVNLTTYQQAYNACARLIQASQDMYTTLMQVMP